MTADNEEDLIVIRHDYDESIKSKGQILADKEYNEWLKHKCEVDPEDQRYTWSKPTVPVIYKVLVVLLGAVLAAIAIWRWGR